MPSLFCQLSPYCRTHDREGTLLYTSGRFEITLAPSVKEKEANMTLPIGLALAHSPTF